MSGTWYDLLALIASWVKCSLPMPGQWDSCEKAASSKYGFISANPAAPLKAKNPMLPNLWYTSTEAVFWGGPQKFHEKSQETTTQTNTKKRGMQIQFTQNRKCRGTKKFEPLFWNVFHAFLAVAGSCIDSHGFRSWLIQHLNHLSSRAHIDMYIHIIYIYQKHDYWSCLHVNSIVPCFNLKKNK